MAFFVGRFTEDGQMLGAFALLATVLAVDVRRSDVYVAWAALAGLLLTSAGYARLFRLRGVRVSVLVPRRVTVDRRGFGGGSLNTSANAAYGLMGPPWFCSAACSALNSLMRRFSCRALRITSATR